MTYLGGSSVLIDTWVRISADTKISYEVSPAADEVVVAVGNCCGLTLNMGEAGLRHCVARFTAALDAFTAGALTAASESGGEAGNGGQGDG